MSMNIPAMQQAKLLCFNLSEQEWKILSRESEKLGAAPYRVEQTDFSQTLGALLGILEREKKPCLSPFSEKMIIMSSFDKNNMERFLDSIKKDGVKIPYKAVITPTNLFWHCEDLIKELVKEHEQIRRKQER